MKRITRKILGVLLSVVLIANTVMPNVKAEELINNSVAEETVSGGDLAEEVQETVSEGNEAETGNVYVSEDFQVTYLVTSEWREPTMRLCKFRILLMKRLRIGISDSHLVKRLQISGMHKSMNQQPDIML